MYPSWKPPRLPGITDDAFIADDSANFYDESVPDWKKWPRLRVGDDNSFVDGSALTDVSFADDSANFYGKFVLVWKSQWPSLCIADDTSFVDGSAYTDDKSAPNWKPPWLAEPQHR